MPRLIINIAILLFVAACALAQPAEGDTFWTFKGGAGFSGGPALGYDGTIYAICGDGYLYAINPDGTEKWHREIMPSPNTSPSVGPDGTIYVPGMHNLFAFNPDGSEKWHFPIRSRFFGSPSIAPDSSVYAISRDTIPPIPGYTIYRISRDSSELWSMETDRFVSMKIPIYKDRFLYLGFNYTDSLFKFSLDGTVLDSFQIGCWARHGAIGSSGEFYYCCFGGPLRAVDTTGIELWLFDTSVPYEITPSIGSDGTIYTNGGYPTDSLKAISPVGLLRWGCPIPFYMKNTPSIGSDGVIYIAGNSGPTLEGRIAAIDSDGSIRWVFNLHRQVENYNNPVIGDGVIYMLNGVYVYAIRCSSSGLARSPWPKYGADNQNTGCVRE